MRPIACAASTSSSSNAWRPWLIPVGGLGQLGLAWTAIYSSPASVPLSGLEGWLILDALGKVVLGYLSILFFICSLYAPSYLALRSDRPNRVFCANLFGSLAMMMVLSFIPLIGQFVAMPLFVITRALAFKALRGESVIPAVA